MKPTPIALTQTVAQGGCAAKLPAGSLRAFLTRLALPQPPQLHVGTEKLDDACLWDLGNGDYLIQTLDFFTPIVDDPADFGAIAAANAISDVYAMGGEPRIALTILAFPATTLPLELIEPLMEGATAKIAESGACLAGGHSITDESLKLGFSVTGFVPKMRAWVNAGSKPGDRLILTKGLGTGTITTALKNREAPSAAVEAAIASMKMLNRARDLIEGIDVHAATDITGFGLAGHAMQVAQASKVRIRFQTSRLPILTGALDCLKDGNINRAHKTNLEYVSGQVEWHQTSDLMRWLALDPQTSGGLLLSVPQAQAETALASLKKRFAASDIIGEVLPPLDGAPALEFE